MKYHVFVLFVSMDLEVVPFFIPYSVFLKSSYFLIPCSLFVILKVFVN